MVQERNLWLNLAEMRDAVKICFLDGPILQGGLFSNTVEDFSQQFLAVQKAKAIKHILPPPMQSARRRGRIPTASHLF